LPPWVLVAATTLRNPRKCLPMCGPCGRFRLRARSIDRPNGPLPRHRRGQPCPIRKCRAAPSRSQNMQGAHLPRAKDSMLWAGRGRCSRRSKRINSTFRRSCAGRPTDPEREPRQSHCELCGLPAPPALCTWIQKLILDAPADGVAEAQATDFPGIDHAAAISARGRRPAAASIAARAPGNSR